MAFQRKVHNPISLYCSACSERKHAISQDDAGNSLQL
jgi:hypothetical protein